MSSRDSRFVRCLRWTMSLVLLLLCSANVTAQPRQKPIRLQSAGEFFSETSAGTVAFLPGSVTSRAAQRAWTFDALLHDGSYRLPPQQVCWFMVNHRDTGRAPGTVSYVAVQAALFREYPFTDTLLLYRNANWYRPGDRRFAEVQRTFRVDPEEFLRRHDADDVAGVDQLVGMRWHARAWQSRWDSWARKEYWHENLERLGSTAFRSRFQPTLPEAYHMNYQSYLLRFETTRRVTTERPVVFKIRCSDADFVWLRTFSPDSDDFTHEYFLSVR